MWLSVGEPLAWIKMTAEQLDRYIQVLQEKRKKMTTPG